MGLVMPQVLGMGYGWVQLAMTATLLTLPLWVLLLLPFAKILATSFSIGSGGSGGIFGPGMVIGGIVGAAFWRLGHVVLPGMPADAAPFVIIGMMALFGGIAHAPLAVMLMVAEMTGNLSLLAPAMLAVGVAYLIVGNTTIYANQLNSRADSPAHRARLRFPLLSSLTVAEAQTEAPTTLVPTQTVAEAEAIVNRAELGGAPVVDAAGNLLGVLAGADIRATSVDARATTTAGQAMNTRIVATFPSQTLDVALESLTAARLHWLPVVESRNGRRLVGILTAGDIVRTYRGALNNAVRGVSGLARGADVLDLTVAAGSAVAAHTLAELRLMPDVVVLTIHRGDEVLIPTSATELLPGDAVTLLTRGRTHATLAQLFERNGTRSSTAANNETSTLTT
jgi:CIC family chloride channel protein